MEISSAAKVGMITILSALILGMTYVWLASLKGDHPTGTVYYVIFQRVEGLSKGAAVRMAGVQVGRVFKLEFTPNRKVKVTIDIYPEYDVTLTQESIFTIGQSFVGERWLEISPQSGAPLSAEGTANGVSPVTMDEILAKSEGTLDEIDASMEGFNKFVNDPEFQRNIKGGVAGLKNLTVAFQHTSRDASHLLNGLSDRVSSLTSTANGMMNTISTQVTGLVGDYRGLAGTINRVATASEPEIKGILHNVQGATGELQGVLARVQVLMDKKNTDEIAATIASVHQSAETVHAALEDLRTLITNNPKLKANLEGSAEEAQATLAEAHKVMEKVNRILGRYSGDKDVTPVKGPKQQLLQMNVESEWDAQNGDQSTNLNAWLLPHGLGPIPYGVNIGMDSIGNQNLFNLQADDTLSNGLRARAGVIRSQFGVGFDDFLGEKSSLSLDLYDPHNPQLDLIGRYGFPDFFLMGGLRDTLHDREPVFGIGKQF